MPTADAIRARIGPFIRRLETVAYCYGPDAPDLDLSGLVTADSPERWSDAGAPAAYFAGDLGVLLGEWGRNVDPDAPAEAGLWRVALDIDGIVDVRRRIVRSILDLPEHPAWFLDEVRARDAAARLRYEVGVRGLIVPSMAFPDRPDRANIVAYVDDRSEIGAVATSPRRVGTCRHASSRIADRSGTSATTRAAAAIR